MEWITAMENQNFKKTVNQIQHTIASVSYSLYIIICYISISRARAKFKLISTLNLISIQSLNSIEPWILLKVDFNTATTLCNAIM